MSSFPSPSVDPIQTRGGLSTSALRAVLRALGPLVATVMDDTGAPLTITPPSATYKDAPVAYPQVTVRVLLGRTVIGGGNSLVAFDRARGVAIHAQEKVGSRIVVEVQSLSDAERHTIGDAVRAGIEAAYTTDSTSGVIEAAALDYWDGVGVIVGGFDPDQYPDARLADMRPEGQVYRASLTLRCAISESWLTPLSPMGNTPPLLNVAAVGYPSRTQPTGPTITTTVPIPMPVDGPPVVEPFVRAPTARATL